MGDMQSAASRAGDASRLRLRLVLLLLIHGGYPSSSTALGSAYEWMGGWMHVECETDCWSDVFAGGSGQELAVVLYVRVSAVY